VEGDKFEVVKEEGEGEGNEMEVEEEEKQQEKQPVKEQETAKDKDNNGGKIEKMTWATKLTKTKDSTGDGTKSINSTKQAAGPGLTTLPTVGVGVGVGVGGNSNSNSNSNSARIITDPIYVRMVENLVCEKDKDKDKDYVAKVRCCAAKQCKNEFY